MEEETSPLPHGGGDLSSASRRRRPLLGLLWAGV